MKIFKYDFKFNTFLKKKTPTIEDKFGIYLLTGKQGTNKTWYSIFLTTLQNPKLISYVKTNIKSLKIPNFKMVYFEKITDIINDTDEHVIYIIDEISRKYKKDTPCDKQFYAWLNQSRKRKRIAILITQEYLECPMWLRRPCKYMLTSKSIPILSDLFGIYRCIIGDGYNLVYDKDEGIYTCPTILNVIYKRNMEIANMYDTFEPINDL